MEREILFRGIRKGTNEFLFGDLNHIDGGVYIFPRSEDGDLNSPDFYEVVPETVGQYTEVLDSDGTKIFYGDKMKDKFGAISEVVYVRDFGCYKQLSNIGYSPLNQAEIISSKDTVIGNIHQK